jgi:hypothetical protein
MNKIVGSIGPAIEITETEEFDAATRTLNLIDSSGRIHGRLQWLSSEMDEEGFDRSLLQFCIETMKQQRRRRSPSAAS